MSRNLLAKRTIREIQYSPETIKILLFLQPNSNDSSPDSTASSQIQKQAGKLLVSADSMRKIPTNQYSIIHRAPDVLSLQTISLSIPNLIHKARTRNLKSQRKH